MKYRNNTYLVSQFKKTIQIKNESSIVNQLEEAWIELDSIIGEEILGQGQ